MSNKSTLLWFTLCILALLFGYNAILQRPIPRKSNFEIEQLTTVEHTTNTIATNNTLETHRPRMLSIKTILQMETDFQFAKSRLLERLKVNYGPQVFETVFMDDDCEVKNQTTRCTIGRKTFMKGSYNSIVSWEKTVRKMKLNILEYLRSGQIQNFVWATAYV